MSEAVEYVNITAARHEYRTCTLGAAACLPCSVHVFVLSGTWSCAQEINENISFLFITHVVSVVEYISDSAERGVSEST